MFAEVGMNEQLVINSEKYLLGPKTPVFGKKFFSRRLGQYFKCYE